MLPARTSSPSPVPGPTAYRRSRRLFNGRNRRPRRTLSNRIALRVRTTTNRPGQLLGWFFFFFFFFFFAPVEHAAWAVRFTHLFATVLARVAQRWLAAYVVLAWRGQNPISSPVCFDPRHGALTEGCRIVRWCWSIHVASGLASAVWSARSLSWAGAIFGRFRQCFHTSRASTVLRATVTAVSGSSSRRRNLRLVVACWCRRSRSLRSWLHRSRSGAAHRDAQPEGRWPGVVVGPRLHIGRSGWRASDCVLADSAEGRAGGDGAAAGFCGSSPHVRDRDLGDDHRSGTDERADGITHGAVHAASGPGGSSRHCPWRQRIDRHDEQTDRTTAFSRRGGVGVT